MNIHTFKVAEIQDVEKTIILLRLYTVFLILRSKYAKLSFSCVANKGPSPDCDDTSGAALTPNNVMLTRIYKMYHIIVLEVV